MKRTSLALLPALMASPAWTEPIASKEAARHVGEIETVQGQASVTVMPSGEIYIDLDGSGESAPFSAYISRWNRPQFPDVSYLNGRMIRISGRVGIFRARPEIFLQDSRQISPE